MTKKLEEKCLFVLSIYIERGMYLDDDIDVGHYVLKVFSRDEVIPLQDMLQRSIFLKNLPKIIRTKQNALLGLFEEYDIMIKYLQEFLMKTNFKNIIMLTPESYSRLLLSCGDIDSFWREIQLIDEKIERKLEFNKKKASIFERIFN